MYQQWAEDHSSLEPATNSTPNAGSSGALTPPSNEGGQQQHLAVTLQRQPSEEKGQEEEGGLDTELAAALQSANAVLGNSPVEVIAQIGSGAFGVVYKGACLS